MNLAVNPPVLPMLAKRVGELPPGEGWIFEPKWDGFRTLIFRDSDEVFIQSRDEKPLNRYFPELIDTLKAQLPERCVLDGEIVIAGKEGLEFETLQMRLHPAASRVNKLAVEIPASVVFFDLLCEGDRSLCDAPFRERRARLESVLERVAPRDHDLPVHHAPARQLRLKRERELREVPAEGLLVAALDHELVPVPEDERAEAVPLGLEDPAVAVGERGDALGEHGEERRRDGEHRDPQNFRPTWPWSVK
ncbi:MAG TPA: hypothetical protein VF387_01580, partial [Gemmatimonadaceae bacterium]